MRKNSQLRGFSFDFPRRRDTHSAMSKTETSKKNLLMELAKRKTEAQSRTGKFGILGKDLAGRTPRGHQAQSYAWRGGRIRSGKP
jgi:hypothetical protein